MSRMTGSSPDISRDALLARTFLEISDSLVEKFDVIDLLTTLVDRSIELFDVAAAGLVLADQREKLRVVAASSEEIRLLELFQIQNDQGPCFDCYTSGVAVFAPDIASDERWPAFSKEAADSGFTSVLAAPLRLRRLTLGALNLFQSGDVQIDQGFLPEIEALAGVATIAILHHQAADRSEALVRELQHALDSRVVIEQAKGMIAEYLRDDYADMDSAFGCLRTYARGHNRLLTDVANDVVTGKLSLKAITRGKS